VSPARRRRSDPDAGFTLVELLVVLVILPILLGAVADALIVTVKNASSTENRISDSVDAQLAASYFVRDVQGASEVTTNVALYQAAAGTYSALVPEVCGPASGGGQLIIAFFHPALSGGTALDSAYWLDGSGASSEIDRYSCTLQSDYSSASPIKAVIASAPPTTTTGTGTSLGLKTATQIAPYSFQVAAASGWQTAAASSSVAVYTTLSSTAAAATHLDVSNTRGFTMPGTITVNTNNGPQTVKCTGSIGVDTANNDIPDFTSCYVVATAGSTYTVGLGSAVSQSDMSGVQVAVSAPGSNYNYSLSGSPRSGPSGATYSLGVPTLLALGSTGINLTGNGSYNCLLAPNNDKVCVGGNIVVDGGPISCGTNGIYATQGIASAGGAVSCSGTTVSPSPSIPNPYANILNCFELTPTLQSGYATDPAADAFGNKVPGVYTAQLTGTLEPGVYVADGGVGGVSLAAPNLLDTYFSKNPAGTYDPTSGVLIYIPGAYGGSGSGCQTLPSGVTTLGGVTVGNNGVIAVPPLTVGQSEYWFSGSTSEADLWLWQDQTNGTPMVTSGTTLICSGQVYQSTGLANSSFSSMCAKNSTTTPTAAVIFGLAYLPASIFENAGTDMFLSGRLIISGVAPQNGTPGLTLTGG
jgi:prepilin-type N-terminal cleavage/methylation domain-containing protein